MMVQNKISQSVVNLFEIIVIATMSSGKSTLINSMLGQELLHCANEATTATITRIHNKDKQRNFRGSAYKLKSNRNNKKVRLRSLVDYQNIIDSNTLKEWNADININYINLVGNISSINNINGDIILYDSPGPNNSQDNNHESLTFDLLANGHYNMIIYVLNATQIGINDDQLFLSQVNQVLKTDKSKKIIFILNKADILDEEKGENIGKFVETTASYLESIGFIKPTIIPVSAISALHARKALSQQSLTRFERNMLQQNLNNLDNARLIKASYNISNSFKKISPPNLDKRDIPITIKDGLEIPKSKIESLIYFSGIPLLENIINYNFKKFSL